MRLATKPLFLGRIFLIGEERAERHTPYNAPS